MFGGCIIFPSFGYSTTETNSSPSSNAVSERAQQEDNTNPFLVNFYQPTYFLPFYYTGNPYQQVYVNNTPDNQTIDSSEAKFQFSFKIPVWKNIFQHPSTLYLAYTQLNYWQVYNKSAFFREIDFSPEAFVANEINWHLSKSWTLNFLNLGIVHQSNGKGGDLERSWNRIYAETIFAKDNWMFSFKPWLAQQGADAAVPDGNMVKYLGYERILINYKFHKQIFSLQAQNTVESGFSRGGLQASWSFPLTTHLNAYTQFFSGYGQSLIEYNHYTNSAGVGISLSNWI